MKNKGIALILSALILPVFLLSGCVDHLSEADNILPLNGSIKIKDGVYQTESFNYDGFLITITRGYVVNFSERHDGKRSIINIVFADGKQLSALDSWSNFYVNNSMARIVVCRRSDGCGGGYYEGYIIKVK